METVEPESALTVEFIGPLDYTRAIDHFSLKGVPSDELAHAALEWGLRDKYSEHLKWCEEQGIKVEFTRGKNVDAELVINGHNAWANHRTAVFTFTNARDAALFKLWWG